MCRRKLPHQEKKERSTSLSTSQANSTISTVTHETVRSVVKSNWANVASAIKYIKNAMKTWRVKPGFNWQAMFVKTCKDGYKLEETKKSYEQEEINPPTPEQMALLEQAKQERRIFDIYFSSLTNCTKVVKLNGAQIPWWDFLNLQT